MGQITRDIVLGAACLLSFPAAVHLTHLTSSEDGAPGEPSRVAPSSVTGTTGD